MHSIQFGETVGTTLDKGWGLLPDPMDRCRRQTWWKSVRKEGFWFPSYDDDAFWPTTVPGAFTRIHPQLEYYEGNVVYRVHFNAHPVAASERAFLHFRGVAERCSVFLNGAFLGEHDGGCSAFTFEASSILKQENLLYVLVDNRRLPDTVPGLIHDWWHDGGIHRPVELYYKPKEYLRQCAVTTKLDGAEALITVRVMTDAPSRDSLRTVQVKMFDADSGKIVLDGDINCQPGTWCERIFSIPRSGINLWSPSSPRLHKLEVRLGSDIWSDTTGLREIRTDGKKIMLNGSPLILCGVAAWTEDRIRGGFSHGHESAEETVILLKKLNCNFARAGHRPPSMEFVKACDKAGILLWAEVPAYWISDMQKPAQSRRALHALEETLREHRNSPSVILWSVGNECACNAKDTEQSNIAYFIEAADWLHEHDPSRLVTYTGGLEGTGKESLSSVCPPVLIEKLDVIGLNSYEGINDGAVPGHADEFPMQYDKIRFLSSYGKPVILAEAGIDAVRGEKGFDFGEERQNGYHAKLQALFGELVKEGTLQGMALFVLNDFHTPIKLGRFQRGYNRKGLVDEKLVAKSAFATVRDGYVAIKGKN
jgi:beta-glucuronidase